MKKNNLILHYYGGGSDKIYVCCVKHDLEGWSSISKHGRRGRSLKTTYRLSGVTESEARANQVSKYEEQIRVKGYRDVEGTDYNGNVTRQSLKNWLEPELEDVSGVKEEQQLEFEDGVVVCIDNSGVESSFDLDVEYVSESHPLDDFIWVYDKFGKRIECFSDRFKVGHSDAVTASYDFC